MLRAFECIRACNISQKAVAEAIGWSRTQVNLTFRKGRFPVDAERFKAGVRKWAENSPEVLAWLRERMLTVEALFDWVGQPEPVDLDAAILNVVGRAGCSGPRTADLLTLARVSRYLLEELRCRLEGDEGLPEIETTAAGML